jgi:lipid A 3-O-deacylase
MIKTHRAVPRHGPRWQLLPRASARCALAAALLPGAPLLAAPQADGDTAAGPPASERNASAATGLVPTSVFLQGGTASDVYSVALGALWDLPWQHAFSFGRLATSIEAAIGQWRTHGQRGDNRRFTQAGVTPTLRLYPDAWHGRWFVEAGVGANFIAPVYRTDDKRFSTRFNFGDHIGIGREFGARQQHEFALSVQHFSNAGIDHPNPGETFVQVRWVLRR